MFKFLETAGLEASTGPRGLEASAGEKMQPADYCEWCVGRTLPNDGIEAIGGILLSHLTQSVKQARSWSTELIPCRDHGRNQFRTPTSKSAGTTDGINSVLQRQNRPASCPVCKVSYYKNLNIEYHAHISPLISHPTYPVRNT